jgi:hypothetical protein
MLWNAIKHRSLFDLIVLILLYLGMGFVVGAVFSAHISFQLGETNWGNLWVYLWMMFWPEFVIGLTLYYFMWVFLVIVLLAGIAGWWVQKR